MKSYLGSDLVATLACLDVDDLPHGFGFDLSARLPGCEWLAELEEGCSRGGGGGGGGEGDQQSSPEVEEEEAAGDRAGRQQRRPVAPSPPPPPPSFPSLAFLCCTTTRATNPTPCFMAPLQHGPANDHVLTGMLCLFFTTINNFSWITHASGMWSETLVRESIPVH